MCFEDPVEVEEPVFFALEVARVLRGLELDAESGSGLGKGEMGISRRTRRACLIRGSGSESSSLESVASGSEKTIRIRFSDDFGSDLLLNGFFLDFLGIGS